MYKASETLTGVADVNTGLKFLDKTTVEPYVDDEVPLRGQLQDRRRQPVAVAVETGSDAARGEGARGGPGRPRGRGVGAGALGLGRRFLTLREGSVIVITIVVAAYFAATTDAFLTWENFKTLLPYFAPFAILAAGEVFLMINGEIDLSIGAVYLFTPFLFYEVHNWGLPLLPALALAMLGAMTRGRHQRLLHGRRRHQLVRHHARHAAGARGLHADHLRRPARGHAGHVGHRRA